MPCLNEITQPIINTTNFDYINHVTCDALDLLTFLSNLIDKVLIETDLSSPKIINRHKNHFFLKRFIPLSNLLISRKKNDGGRIKSKLFFLHMRVR